MRVQAAFLGQARACGAMGSPFMERLCTLFAERLQPGTPVADRLLAWPGDASPAGQSLPMRICGGLHALLLTGAAPDLAALYPPNEAGDDALWEGVSAALGIMNPC